jgi:hypothetical protein
MAQVIWVGVGGGGCFSTPHSRPLLLPALSLLSRPESRVWALHVTCGPRAIRRRVRPVPWALVVQGAPFCVGASTPVRLVGFWCVCTVHQQRPHDLQGPWGRVTGCVSGMCGWGGRVPHPSFPGPVLHATACVPLTSRPCVCLCECVFGCGRCVRLACACHTHWSRDLAGHGVWGPRGGVVAGGEVPVATALRLPCWSRPGRDGATHALTGPVRS